jgi:hypothetical protein
MEEEEQRSDILTSTGETSNPEAPRLVRTTKAPPRSQKAFYIQEKYAHAFDALALTQKRIKGPKATDLAEEMIRDLLIKYGQDVSIL